MKQIKKFTKVYILGHVLGNEIVHKDQVTETNNSNDRRNIGIQKTLEKGIFSQFVFLNEKHWSFFWMVNV